MLLILYDLACFSVLYSPFSSALNAVACIVVTGRCCVTRFCCETDERPRKCLTIISAQDLGVILKTTQKQEIGGILRFVTSKRVEGNFSYFLIYSYR